MADRRVFLLSSVRNVGIWTVVGVAVLQMFLGIGDSYQNESVRIASAIIGYTVALIVGLLAAYVHFEYFYKWQSTMAALVFLTSVVPGLFFVVTFFATDEFKVATPKN